MERARLDHEGKPLVKPAETGTWASIRETLKVGIQALLIALVVRTLLFQPFNIPSGSLVPTLLIGDYLFVSKYSYGYSKYSLPMSEYIPIKADGRIWAAEPKRGDIAVFKLPKDNATDYIKRVIGLPGDKIQMIDGVLNINGKAVKRERIADYETIDPYGQATKVPQYLETLPNGVVHNTIERGRRQRVLGQDRAVHGARRSLFHDGRQPRQLHRFPRPRQCRLRAVRQLRRARRDDLLLDRRGHARLADLELAGACALVAPVLGHPLSGRV